MLGNDASTSLVAGGSLTNRACNITFVNLLSCKEDKRDGSWNTYTVTTSIAEQKLSQSRRQFHRVDLLEATYTLHKCTSVGNSE